MKKNKKWIIWIFVIAVLLGAAYLCFSGHEDPKEEESNFVEETSTKREGLNLCQVIKKDTFTDDELAEILGKARKILIDQMGFKDEELAFGYSDDWGNIALNKEDAEKVLNQDFSWHLAILKNDKYWGYIGPDSRCKNIYEGGFEDRIAIYKLTGDGDEESFELAFSDSQEEIENPDVPTYIEIDAVSTKEQNAYEYIVSLMKKPQYWSEDEYFPAYFSPWEEEEARKTLINATGWELIDEETATFKRGYEGTLTLNFSDYIAISKDEASGLTYVLDFKNDEYYMSSGSEKTKLTLNKNIDGYYNTSFGKIEQTFVYYEKLFSASGCPLLEKPKGTLTGYRKAVAHEAFIKDDNLIHNVWEQEGFSFDFTNKEGLSWLKDYRDILNAKTPDLGLVPFQYGDGKGNYETFNTAYNTPVFLVLADSHEGERYLQYDNIDEAFAAYYLKPVFEILYGYDAVYFVNGKSANGPSDPLNLDTKEDILAGFTWDYANNTQPILEIQNKGEKIDGICYLATGFNDLEQLIRTVEDRIKTYYPEKTIPFGKDYLGNFKLIYDKETQITLGLR